MRRHCQMDKGGWTDVQLAVCMSHGICSLTMGASLLLLLTGQGNNIPAITAMATGSLGGKAEVVRWLEARSPTDPLTSLATFHLIKPF